MGLFSFLRKKKELPLSTIPQEDITLPENEQSTELHTTVPGGDGIFRIYNYLQQDFEAKGFNDALISPDDGYKNDNIRLIRYDLEILIHQVKTYHDSLMKDMEFHIHSRGRAGLIDLVDELKIKQTDLLDHMEKVKEFERSVATDSGLCERAILAYKRGFMKGMASITQAYLLNKKILVR